MAKIDIDINNIFYQLHETAVERAKSFAADFEIYNTGINEELKVPSFTGSGQYFICIAAKDETTIPDSGVQKNDVFEAFKEYIKSFCDAESANNLNEDQLEPIEVGQKIKHKKNDSEENEKNVDESLLSELFGTDEDDDTIEESTSGKKIIGYLLPYQAIIKGEKLKPAHIGLERLGKHLKKIGHAILFKAIPSLLAAPFSLLGKALGSFEGISFDAGPFGKVNTKLGLGVAAKVPTLAAKGIKKGGDLAAAGYAQVKQNLTIDLTTIISDISKAFNDEFSNNDVHIRVYPTKILIEKLKAQGKFTSKIQAKITTGSEHCIGIIVNSDDDNYISYNKESIATIVTKGIANQNDSMFTATITKDMILKVAGYGVKKGAKVKPIYYETKTNDEIALELTSFLFEDGAVTKKVEAINYCKQAADLIKRCSNQEKFWREFELDSTVPNVKLATKAIKTKGQFKKYFQEQIRKYGLDKVEIAILSKFDSSIPRALAFLNLVTKTAAKVGVTPSTKPNKNNKKPSFEIEKPGKVYDMYIVVRKRMKYVDADEKGGKK